MAFYCFGPSSIYIVNILVLVAYGILPTAYFSKNEDHLTNIVIFADLARSIPHSISGKDNFWTSKTPYVIILGVALLPLILKKKIQELKIASIILFVGIACFVLLLAVQLIDGIPDEYRDVSDTS